MSNREAGPLTVPEDAATASAPTSDSKHVQEQPSEEAQGVKPMTSLASVQPTCPTRQVI